MNRILLLAGLLSSYILSAQGQLTVIDSTIEFSKGLQSAYYVAIPETRLKDVQKDWIAYLRPLSKDKMLLANGEISITNALYPNISANPLYISSRLLETSQGVRLTVWFAEDSVHYISRVSNADHNIGANKFVHDFAVIEYKKVVMVQVNNNKRLEQKMENNLNHQIKSEDKSVIRISQNQRYIERNGVDIQHNEMLQKIKTDAIDAQKQMMQDEHSTDPDVLKLESKKLNGLISDFNKLRNQAEKMHKQIDNWNQGIKEAQRTIDNAKKSQEGLAAQIETQKGVVQGFQDKYDGIK